MLKLSIYCEVALPGKETCNICLFIYLYPSLLGCETESKERQGGLYARSQLAIQHDGMEEEKGY